MYACHVTSVITLSFYVNTNDMSNWLTLLPIAAFIGKLRFYAVYWLFADIFADIISKWTIFKPFPTS